MDQRIWNASLALLLGTALNSCGTGLLEQRVAEGVIEYALSFPDYDPNGVFRTTMVTDNTAKALNYHLSLMSKKIVAHMGSSDLELFNPATNKPTILYTNETDTIAGYPCKKAVAIYDGMDQVESELWYTDRIAMSDPNWFGPFAEVPGVLMRYDVVQYGMRMRLNALTVTPGEVDPAKFEPKKEFEQVPAEVLHQELAEVLGTFSM
jgi:GLPGLI family protein